MYKYINDAYSQITRDGKCWNMTKEAKRSDVYYINRDGDIYKLTYIKPEAGKITRL